MAPAGARRQGSSAWCLLSVGQRLVLRWLSAVASCMSPDSIVRPAGRAPRGLARCIAGLALVAVVAACSSGDDVAGGGSTPASAPTMTASSNRSPASSGTTPSDGIDGPYTLRIPRIGVAAPVVPIQSNEDRVLNPPQDPSVAGWWSQGAAPGEPTGSAMLVGHTVRNKG